MSKTNLPGFTADLSLYRTSGHYQSARGFDSFPQGNPLYPAMIATDGVNCSNCVGGDCAELHCFENWTHSGGGPGGPYVGGGGGGGVSGGCRNGAISTKTIVLPPGGPEHTYVIRQRCVRGQWVDYPF